MANLGNKEACWFGFYVIMWYHVGYGIWAWYQYSYIVGCKKIKKYIFFIIIEPNFFGIYYYYYYYRCWYYLLLLTIPEIVHDLGYMVFIVR